VVKDKFKDGDFNFYASDPFTYRPKNETNNTFPSLFSQGVSSEKDYTSVVGLNLINFRKLKAELDPLNGGDTIKGFTPRWLLPSKLRNITNTNRNTSCIMIIIDSKREVDLGMIPPFS
jgi:hypothetical protein